MAVINLTKVDFLKSVGDFETDPSGWVYKGDKPCIVNFTAPWCVYCKRLAPILEELCELFCDDIYIYSVDVDKEEDLDKAFNIHTIPTLMFCKENKEKEMILGTMPKNELKDIIIRKLL